MMMDRATEQSLLTQIGGAMMAAFEDSSSTGWLYVEAIPGVMAPTLYEVTKSGLMDRFINDELSDLVRKLWYLPEPEKRWTELEIKIVDHAFDAQFRYEPDAERAFAQFGERREALLAQRFGDMPVTYLPPPDDAF
ncbi:hypothetical protein [Flavisphingopyxis soli]|nr:hypothetical protein [Sphingorhabdus soli]